MPSQTQDIFNSFQKWSERVAQEANWKAEKNFISSRFRVKDSNGFRMSSPSEWERERSHLFSDRYRIEINDLIVKKEKLCYLFTVVYPTAETRKEIIQGGIQIIRYEGGKMAETWIAMRPPEEGAWPKAFEREKWSVSVSESDEIIESEEPVVQAMIRYQEIRRTNEAEGLRDLFVEPMIVHGPGPTRTESLDEFIKRVKNEPKEWPGFRNVWHDMFVAKNKAVMRWTYLFPANSNETKSSGITIYEFEKGKIVERWQAALPLGIGWSDI